MKITLISPYPDITSFGVRTLSAHLKKHGHAVQLIFLPDPFGDNLPYGVQRYEEKALDQAAALCTNSDLIGLTLMTNFFDGAVQITRKLKSACSAPVVWGGVHPTIRPEESLEHADMVCIGEGEDALLALVDKMSKGEDYTSAVNFWFKREDGEVAKNPLSPLPQNLDVYPLPDYSMEDHHVMVAGRVAPLTHDILRAFLRNGTVASYLGKTGYQTMTSRGCPYSCAYCINDTIRKMYGGKGKLRWRSVSHIMDELSRVRKDMSYVDYIWISDDEFMARKMSDLEEFCRQYKEKIALPFSCLVSPLTVTEEKMELLVNAGLVYVQMGVESGSAKMQELFRRKNMTNSKMMRAIHIINKFKDRMYAPSYDFLIDVPYETDNDRIDSLRFISDIPKPYRLQPFTLILYPGTQLYDMAKEKGLIHDESREIYNKTYTMREPDYLNLLMTLSKDGHFPGKLLKFLISPPVLNILNSEAMKPLIKLAFAGMRGAYHTAKRVVARS
jgi:radical SAM superfamily enzyme YgiQ (UPF0313 family)